MQAVTLPAPIATLTHTRQPCAGYQHDADSGPCYTQMVVRYATASYPSPGEAMRVALHADMPTNAIVATAEVAEALPIYDGSKPTGPHWEPPSFPCVTNDGNGRLTLWTHHDGGHADISDRLPFADWSPGRWAFPLTDVQPTTSRCPACWGDGRQLVESTCETADIWKRCATCGGEGYCAPVPAKGRPGWWTWTP